MNLLSCRPSHSDHRSSRYFWNAAPGRSLESTVVLIYGNRIIPQHDLGSRFCSCALSGRRCTSTGCSLTLPCRPWSSCDPVNYPESRLPVRANRRLSELFLWLMGCLNFSRKVNLSTFIDIFGTPNRKCFKCWVQPTEHHRKSECLDIWCSSLW